MFVQQATQVDHSGDRSRFAIFIAGKDIDTATGNCGMTLEYWRIFCGVCVGTLRFAHPTVVRHSVRCEFCRVGKVTRAHVFYSITRKFQRPFPRKAVEIKVNHRRDQQRDHL